MDSPISTSHSELFQARPAALSSVPSSSRNPSGDMRSTMAVGMVEHQLSEKSSKSPPVCARNSGDANLSGWSPSK